MEPTEDQYASLKFWNALHSVLLEARSTIPYFNDPDRMHWDHPDDAWKNNAALDSIEQDVASDINELITYFCTHRTWPKRSKNNARFFVEKRIQWAIGFIRILTIPLPQLGKAAIPRPKESGWALLQWLLIDAYHERFAPPAKSSFRISGVNGKVIEIKD